MKLSEAIEIKSRTGQEFLNTEPDEFEEADRLVIEAAKQVRDTRLTYNGVPIRLLPGETEE